MSTLLGGLAAIWKDEAEDGGIAAPGTHDLWVPTSGSAKACCSPGRSSDPGLRRTTAHLDAITEAAVMADLLRSTAGRTLITLPTAVG
jgi:hypothetical protein